MALVIKNPPANAGNVRGTGSIPGSGRSLGGGHDNQLHYSCLENPMERRAWWATVHGVAKSWTLLKQLSTVHHRKNIYFCFLDYTKAFVLITNPVENS